jgi:hypothetical protein
VRDKNNSHGDWREDIFYNRRNGKETENKRKNSISGIIMVIMIISFGTKTNTDFPDHTDTRKRMIAHPLLSSPPLGRG